MKFYSGTHNRFVIFCCISFSLSISACMIQADDEIIWPLSNDMLASLVDNISKNEVRNILECNFGYKEMISYVILDNHHCIYIVNKSNSGKHKLIFRYQDRYMYTCDSISVESGFSNSPLTSRCLLTKWSKHTDQALILFGRRGNQIVPVFQKLGGRFKVEIADINNDGLSDLLISDLKWVKVANDSHLRPDNTSIYLRQHTRKSEWFILNRRVPWSQRWAAYTTPNRK